MAIDPSIIAAGVAAIGSGASAYAQGKQNKKTRKWNEKMHGLIRSEGLADYHMQNQYNSPEAQMARLKAAGLNPNLVYGTGTLANEGATVKPAGVESWDPKAPDIGAIPREAISTYYDSRLKRIQVDNLAKTGVVLDEEARLKRAQQIATLAGSTNVDVDTLMKRFDLGLKTEIRPVSVQAAQAHLEKTQHETSLIATEENIKKAMQQPNINKIVAETINAEMDTLLKEQTIGKTRVETQKIREEIEEVKQRVKNLFVDGQLKQFEYWMKESRGKVSDWPAIMKAGYDVVEGILRNFIPIKK